MSKQRNADPKARRSAGKRLPVWSLVVGAVVLGGAALGVVLGYELATRTSPDVVAEKAIVGKWVNETGGEIDFYADGTGYLPPGFDIEAYGFTYYLQDATHLVMTVQDQDLTVEFRLVGDKLTWYTADPNVKYVYTRVK